MAFLIIPIILGGIAASQLPNAVLGDDTGGFISAFLSLLAGFFPAIYVALNMDMQLKPSLDISIALSTDRPELASEVPRPTRVRCDQIEAERLPCSFPLDAGLDLFDALAGIETGLDWGQPSSAPCRPL